MELIEILLSACESEDVSLVQDLLGKDNLVDMQNIEGVTPLQMASANGQDAVVDFLLTRGADVNLTNHSGWSPLMHALFNGHVDTSRILIHNRADIITPSKLGLTPLAAACAGGNVSCVRLLLETESLSGLQMQHEEFSGILAASLHGHEDVIKLLLDHDVNINHVDSVTKLTALMLAASNGQRPCVQLLVEHGADVNLTSVCHRTVLDIASACGKWEIKAYLGDKTIHGIGNEKYGKEHEAPIFIAIKQNKLKEVNRILDQDHDACNRPDGATGSTPLIEATILGRSEIVAELLERGANVDAQDAKEGWTALMHAVSHRRLEIVSKLLAKGASIDVHPDKGCTVLDLLWVSDGGNKDLIELFMNWKNPTEKLLSVPEPSPNSSSLKYSSKSSTLRRSFRNSSFRVWMSSHFGHLKRSRSTTSLSAMSPSSNDDEDGNVFDEKEGSPLNSPKNNNTSTAIVKLSSFQWPKKTTEVQRDWSRKQVNPPLLPSPSKWHIPLSKDHMPPIRPKGSSPIKAFCPVHLMKQIQSSKKSCGIDVPAISPPLNMNGNYKGLRCQQWNEEETSPLEYHSRFQNKLNFDADVRSGPEVEVFSHSNVTTTTDEMEHFLQHLSLERYVPKFQEHEMDLEALKSVTEKDLQEIGVLSLGPRQQLLNAISQL